MVREGTGEGEIEEKLTRSESSRYRAVAARANYLGIDRPDLQFAVKETCTEMSAPGASELRRV